MDLEAKARLRASRQARVEARCQARLRRLAAPHLVASINRALGQSLSIDEFEQRPASGSHFVLTPRIEEATGVVAAHVSRFEAERLLRCVSKQLGWLRGRLGFHDKSYLGFAYVTNVNALSLLEIAESTNEAVLFFTEQPAGGLWVDYDAAPGRKPFSVALQGDALALATPVVGTAVARAGGGGSL